MVNIGVVHLVRAKNGLAPFQRFMQSYADNPGGEAHDLILIFKGFPGSRLPPQYADLVPPMSRTIFVSDAGFDITAYFAAAHQLEHSSLCFLNSYSTFLDPEWLAKLSAVMDSSKGIGLVGASGSWASIYSLHGSDRLPPNKKTLRERALFPLRQYRYARYFNPFPNYHLRSNAFLIPCSLMQRIQCRPLWRKIDALRFESGRDSLTRQVEQMGLRTLVVGRDGRGYDKEEWDQSAALWQADQANLLVADNQTEKYQHGNFALRQFLSWTAWGEQSRPASN